MEVGAAISKLAGICQALTRKTLRTELSDYIWLLLLYEASNLAVP